MDFSSARTPRTQSLPDNSEIFQGYSRRISQGSTDSLTRIVLIIYASGSLGANKDLEIQRGELQRIMSQNFYLCELEHSKKCFPNLEYLVSPATQSGVRIQYKVVELDKIDSSINLSLEQIGNIAKIIKQNYSYCHSFIVVTGLDTICHVGSTLSFMLQNLSKLVICTGGYLPLLHMRNDSVSNLLECFSVAAEASTLCDVIIVTKNKGYRANRCIKMTEGDFQTIASPNLPALCSIKTKIRARSALFRSAPSEQFLVFTELSRKVKILRLNQFQSLESLQYQLANPHVKGVVITSYSYANIPNLPQLLNLFKTAYEQRKVIFINISESICSKNQSVMKSYLQQFHIYFGADMTTQAALVKLSYLIGKGYTDKYIIKLMQSNMRGQLTEQKQMLQFQNKDFGTMQIVNETLNANFPTLLRQMFQHKIQNNLSKYLISIGCSVDQFKQVFQSTNLNEKQNRALIAEMTNSHDLLHRAVSQENYKVAEFLVNCGANVNQEDCYYHSPMFYALKNKNKSLLQLLSKKGGKIITLNANLFEIFIQSLKQDDAEFFNLIFHIQFKQTLKTLKNSQKRSVSHLAALFGAKKSYEILKQKFRISLTQQDIYGETASAYYSAKSK